MSLKVLEPLALAVSTVLRRRSDRETLVVSVGELSWEVLWSVSLNSDALGDLALGLWFEVGDLGWGGERHFNVLHGDGGGRYLGGVLSRNVTLYG